jgi:Mitochondrial domain of unknown function (DUF1713)
LEFLRPRSSRPRAGPGRTPFGRAAPVPGETFAVSPRGDYGSALADLLSWQAAMGSLIKKRRKRMRKKKHKKMLKATRWQRRAGK